MLGKSTFFRIIQLSSTSKKKIARMKKMEMYLMTKQLLNLNIIKMLTDQVVGNGVLLKLDTIKLSLIEKDNLTLETIIKLLIVSGNQFIIRSQKKCFLMLPISPRSRSSTLELKVEIQRYLFTALSP